MKIVLPLPAALTSLFIVTLTVAPVTPWRLTGPHSQAAMAALGTPRLRLIHHPTPWKPGAIPLTPDERRLLRRSGQHLTVSSTAPPHASPAAAQAARAAARALARTYEGLLFDPLTGGVLPARHPEPAAFDLADGWLGWDIRVHDDATCPPWDPAGTAACDGLTITSRGLRRFGLPEITLDGAACAHTLCAADLLRTVAARLVAGHLAFASAHPDARRRAIDDHLPLPPGPLGVRLTPCAPAPSPGRGSIRRLRVRPATGPGPAACLQVGPPSGFTGSLNDWLCATPTPLRTGLTPTAA
ncbi:hypothetical protein OUY22_19635 [Nonomuraea sp. MCN248]|uniref:Uncharacterized protein n=1 Tax=Nonomuraea corallina TaxID=2989783 RepID=A0ABT4SEL4_9ACTN|nr:hypothetical protein [Nonomuraea corallina]MDA0635637.1 hypothetical protein [Nonomuraea corallina]